TPTTLARRLTVALPASHIGSYRAICIPSFFFIFFFFNHTATTEIYTLSLHDALPIYFFAAPNFLCSAISKMASTDSFCAILEMRSEEHTSELQSRGHLVCRLLLEKKNCLPVHSGARA